MPSAAHLLKAPILKGRRINRAPGLLVVERCSARQRWVFLSWAIWARRPALLPASPIPGRRLPGGLYRRGHDKPGPQREAGVLTSEQPRAVAAT